MSSDDTCKVCGAVKEFNLCVSFCGACKKFFLRNREKPSVLKCATGSNNCSNLRNCSFCRLEKCFEIGIRGRGRVPNSEMQRLSRSNDEGPSTSGAAASSSSEIAHSHNGAGSNEKEIVLTTELISTSVPEKPPILFDGVIAETTLRLVINAATIYAAADETPMRKPGLDVSSSSKCWTLMMSHMHAGRVICSAYSNYWREITKIDGMDMEPFIFNGMIALSSAYMALPSNKGASVLAVNDNYLVQILSFFPLLQPGTKAISYLSGIISNWNPSSVEAGFFMCYAFFNEKVAMTAAVRQRCVEIRRYMLALFKMYLSAEGQSQDYIEFAAERFLKASKTLDQISDAVYHNLALFAKLYPQLAETDSLFNVMFGQFVPPKERELGGLAALMMFLGPTTGQALDNR